MEVKVIKKFDDLFDDDTKNAVKFKKEDYLLSGKNVIIDQNSCDEYGYTNINDGIYKDVPTIVFGDHTRVIKYIETPFFLGADGAKILKQKNNDNYMKYLYYYLKSKRIENLGYSRHYKLLKELSFEICTKNEQKKIVLVLDCINRIKDLYQSQLKSFDLLVKSRFVEMFGDPISNEKKWQKKKLSEECDIVTGNTPSRAKPEYYGDYIEWIKSDNINTPNITLTKAQEYLSEEGLKVGRSVEKGAILMTCIAGSLSCIGNVAITDRKVSFNQQINAIVPKKNNTYFMYMLFELTKEELQSSINMMLKGIMSKSKLEEQEYIFPPIELQNEYADFVQQVDKSKFVEKK